MPRTSTCVIVLVSVEVFVEVAAESPEGFGAAMARMGREKSRGKNDLKRILSWAGEVSFGSESAWWRQVRLGCDLEGFVCGGGLSIKVRVLK